MKNIKFNITFGILFFGFAVLIGSFAFFGESLNEKLEVASLPSIEGKNIYHQCFEEICKKPVDEFTPAQPDYTGLIDDKLDEELNKFTVKYSENEVEIQRLVKLKIDQILSGELTGEVDFGLFDIKKIYIYQYYIIQSFTGGVSFQAYLNGSFKEKISEIFKEESDLKKWAEKGFLFDEIIDVQKLSGRYDLETYSREIYPNVADYKERLKLLSLKITNSSKDLKWLLGVALKDQTWPAEMFLETGLFNEADFMDELAGVYYIEMVNKAKKEITTMEKIKAKFKTFAESPSYRLIFDEGLIYDAFMSFDSMCRETIQDDLYWASSDLKNRAVEKHFSKLKTVAATMFKFEDQFQKAAFDDQVNKLELIKSRSIQETKGFYPFYFKTLLSAQKKSIELLKSGNFKDTVMYLQGYIGSLPEVMTGGESPEDREAEAYHFVRKLSLDNGACKTYENMLSFKGSFFSPLDNYMYVEMRSLRHFGDGVMTLAHELGHGISFLFKNDISMGFSENVESKVWKKRICIDKYYPNNSKGEAGEALQTEEDWADYFAVQLVKEYKKTGDYSWANEKFECEFVKPYELDPENGDPIKPAEYFGVEDTHSSNLFRLIAQEFYSKGGLGPLCSDLAKKETKILDKCE